MPPVYAIGDIHGQLDMLQAAHARIRADQNRMGARGTPVVHLGDLTDRGPDSRGTLEYLMHGLDAGENWLVIKGNHDRMFSRFVRDADPIDDHIKSGKTWLHDRLGGPTTLASYGVDISAISADMTELGLTNEGTRAAWDRLRHEAASKVPEQHLAFLDALPLTHISGDLLFVHAGLRPGVPLNEQREDDLIWIRDGWLGHTGAHSHLIVHGHTALDAPLHHGNRVNLDSGAGYGRPLTAAVIEDRNVFVLTETSREPLLPESQT